MITENQYKSMTRTLNFILDCESALRLLKERISFATNLSNDDLLIFISEEINNTVSIIDKKIYDDILNQRLAATNSLTPENTCCDEK